MARVPYLRPEDLAEGDRDVLARPFNLWRALANSPATSRAFQAYVAHLWNANRLERRLVELVILQVAAVCGVPYEWVHHVRLGLQNGVSAEEIRAIGPDGARGDRFGAREAAALAAALEIARDGGVGPATHARLAASFDPAERVELSRLGEVGLRLRADLDALHEAGALLVEGGPDVLAERGRLAAPAVDGEDREHLGVSLGTQVGLDLGLGQATRTQNSESYRKESLRSVAQHLTKPPSRCRKSSRIVPVKARSPSHSCRRDHRTQLHGMT